MKNQRKLRLVFIFSILIFSSCKILYGGMFEGQLKMPDEISGLCAWYMADKGLFDDDACSIEQNTDGHTVSCWKDQSGRDNNLIGSAGGVPVFVAKSPINQGKSLKFYNSTGTFLYNNSFTGAKDSGTIITVTYSLPDANADRYIASLFNGMIYFSQMVLSEKYTTTTNVMGSNLVSQKSNNENIIFVTTYDKNQKKLAQYINGAAEGESLGVDISGNVPANFYVGLSGAGMTYFEGYISEILVYDHALSEIERKEIELYLSKKYDIALND